MSAFEKLHTGAVRSSDRGRVRLDLVTPIALIRAADAYAEGAKKYSDHNYLKGFPASNLLNHLYGHLLLYQLGDRSEDHLGHALWNLMTLAHFDVTRPDLIDLPPYNLTAEQLNRMKEMMDGPASEASNGCSQQADEGTVPVRPETSAPQVRVSGRCKNV